MDKQTLINTLEKIYHQSKTDNDYNGLKTVLEAIKINNLVNYYNNIANTYDSEDSIIIEFIIRILQNIYNNSGVESPVSDEDYDKLYEIFLNISERDIVGGDNMVRNNKEIANHLYPDLRGTLDKIHFITDKEKGNDKRKSLEGWMKSAVNRLGRNLTDNEWLATLYPKFDGVSVVFECDKYSKTIQALTRGDTDANEATILKIFKLIQFKPIEGWDSDFGVKTEVIMTYDNFKKFCKKYGAFKSPRSAVSSIVNSSEAVVDMLRYITIVPLRYQNFDTKEIIIPPEATLNYPSIVTNLNSDRNRMEAIESIKSTMSEIMGIPIDGVVIRLNDPNIQRELGRDGAINKYEVAYKFAPTGVRTKVIDVEFCIGLLGNITPVAIIEPIVMEGNTIENVSLNSIDRFESLHLHKGDEVLIKYDIIPYAYIDDSCKKSNGEPILTPTHCQYCGEQLVYDPVLRCVNNNCPSRQIGKIVNYTEKMNIENVSLGTVTYLFKEGYLTSIEDLYRLEDRKKSLAELKGLGSKSVERIIKGINKRKEVFDYDLLGSIGIPSVSSKTFKQISNIYYIDDIIEIAEKNQLGKLTEIRGIQEKTANKIIVGILMNLELIQFLRSVLRVKHDGREYKMKVVFTKVRDKDFEKYLDSKDIEVCESYSKNVDMIICEKENTSSSKVDKAKKDGKKVLTIKEAYSFFKYNK